MSDSSVILRGSNENSPPPSIPLSSDGTESPPAHIDKLDISVQHLNQHYTSSLLESPRPILDSSDKQESVDPGLQDNGESKSLGTGFTGSSVQLLTSINSISEEGSYESDSTSELSFSDLDMFVKPHSYSVPYDELNCRARLHYLLHNEHGSKIALSYQIFQVIALLLSILVFLIQSLPAYWNKKNLALQIIEGICVGAFTLDYVLRYIATRKPKIFPIRPMNIIDLLSFAPYYVELIISAAMDEAPDLSTLVVFRLLRTLRIIKIGRISKEIPITVIALKKSRRGFVLLGAIISIVMVIASTSLFYAEQTESIFINGTWIYTADGMPTDFQSIPATFWWYVVTATGVEGYGDTYPRTPLGKTVAAATMLCGVVILSFPYAILSYNFTSTWNAYHSRRKIRKIAPLKRNPRTLSRLIRSLEQRSSSQYMEIYQMNNKLTTMLNDQRHLHSYILSLKLALISENSSHDSTHSNSNTLPTTTLETSTNATNGLLRTQSISRDKYKGASLRQSQPAHSSSGSHTSLTSPSRPLRLSSDEIAIHRSIRQSVRDHRHTSKKRTPQHRKRERYSSKAELQDRTVSVDDDQTSPPFDQPEHFELSASTLPQISMPFQPNGENAQNISSEEV